MKFYKTFSLLFVFLGNAYADTNCINPKDYARSTVSIGKYISGVPVFGTAWFYKNQKTLVTAGHVARFLADKNSWAELEIQQRENRATFVSRESARILKLGNIGNATNFEIAAIEKYAKEDLAVVELERLYPEARPLKISSDSAAHYSPLWAIAYTEMKLVIAKGRTLPPGIEEKLENDYPSMVHIEIFGNRRSLIEGSSGSPALNCAGEVSAIVNLSINDTYVSSGGKIVRRIPKGTATNYALPSGFVEELMSRK